MLNTKRKKACFLGVCVWYVSVIIGGGRRTGNLKTVRDIVFLASLCYGLKTNTKVKMKTTNKQIMRTPNNRA